MQARINLRARPIFVLALCAHVACMLPFVVCAGSRRFALACHIHAQLMLSLHLSLMLLLYFAVPPATEAIVSDAGAIARVCLSYCCMLYERLQSSLSFAVVVGIALVIEIADVSCTSACNLRYLCSHVCLQGPRGRSSGWLSVGPSSLIRHARANSGASSTRDGLAKETGFSVTC